MTVETMAFEDAFAECDRVSRAYFLPADTPARRVERAVAWADDLLRAGVITGETRERIRVHAIAGSSYVDSPVPVRYRKPLASYARLASPRDHDDMAAQLREALAKADAAPAVPKLSFIGDMNEIDAAAYQAIGAMHEWLDFEEARGGGDPSVDWTDAAMAAAVELRWHELLLIIKRIGRLRAPWVLMPATSGYFLELLTADDPSTEQHGLLIYADLPKDHVRALVDAYEAGIKRGRRIVEGEIFEGVSRARRRRS